MDGDGLTEGRWGRLFGHNRPPVAEFGTTLLICGYVIRILNRDATLHSRLSALSYWFVQDRFQDRFLTHARTTKYINLWT